MNIIAKIPQKSRYLLVLTVVAVQMIFPYASASAPAQASDLGANNVNLLPDYLTEQVYLIKPFKSDEAVVEEKIRYQVVKSYKITVTAYSSTVDQTDDTPCFTANNFDLCTHNQEDVIAANFLPFGTKVRIPEYFGDRIFTVQDRMNARYYYRADVWMKTRKAAWDFGAPYTEVEVVEEI